jgi:hypothetical protein
MAQQETGDPWSIAPSFTEKYRRVRADRLRRYHEKGIIESLQEKDAIFRQISYATCFMCCICFCSDPDKDGTVGNNIDKFYSAVAARVPRSLEEACFLFSFNGYLLNRHRFILTTVAIMGACAAFIYSPTDSADGRMQVTNATSGSVYAFLEAHCDRMPEGHYDGAHFSFWTIWLLISLYCAASTAFVLGVAFSEAMARCCSKSSARKGLYFVLVRCHHT